MGITPDYQDDYDNNENASITIKDEPINAYSMAQYNDDIEPMNKYIMDHNNMMAVAKIGKKTYILFYYFMIYIL